MPQIASPSCDFCVQIFEPRTPAPLDEYLESVADRLILSAENFVVMPTIGQLRAGYLLIVPRRHLTSLAYLDVHQLEELSDLVERLQKVLRDLYGLPVIAFEQGLPTTGIRRIEHAHLHLLPWPTEPIAPYLRAAGSRCHELPDLSGLAAFRPESYVYCWGPDRRHLVFGVGTGPDRPRLREIVADSDPSCRQAWDWTEEPGADLIRQTVRDLRGAL